MEVLAISGKYLSLKSSTEFSDRYAKVKNSKAYPKWPKVV
jgi:hypothetical protein